VLTDLQVQLDLLDQLVRQDQDQLVLQDQPDLLVLLVHKDLLVQVPQFFLHLLYY
jgi:hypothetical protein